MNLESNPLDDHQRRRSWLKSQWQENHGNVLLGFVAGIVLLGTSGLTWRQLRTEQPSLAEGTSVADPRLGSFDAAAGRQDRIQFRVTGAVTTSGSMVIAIYDSAEDWGIPDRARRLNSVAFTNGVARWELDADELPARFAVVAFHDDNRDGVLTVNPLGVAAERYGYSGGARIGGPDQPPTFAEAVMERPEPGGTIDLFIR